MNFNAHHFFVFVGNKVDLAAYIMACKPTLVSPVGIPFVVTFNPALTYVR